MSGEQEGEGERDPILLGIECGGTRTTVLEVGPWKALRRQNEFGPCNLKLSSDREIRSRFREVARSHAHPSAIGLAVAGARTGDDRERLRRLASSVWKGVPLKIAHDLECAWWAMQPETFPGGPTVIVLSGTGSCCYGRDESGRESKVGGWGHQLGDRGSGYDIARRALRAVVADYDRRGRWSALGARLLNHLQLNDPEALVDWVTSANKSEVAALAVEVFAAAAQRDAIARSVLAEARAELVEDATICARRLVARRSGTVRFALMGGVLSGQPIFARRVSQELRQRWSGARVVVGDRSTAWGALELARQARESAHNSHSSHNSQNSQDLDRPVFGAELLGRSPTEARNPRSMKLDRLSLPKAIELMASEDELLPQAIRAERRGIAQLIRWISQAFSEGGRLFYVGAGTSGRLGVLDASECPPTFRTDPDQVQGIIAGGRTALWRSVEGAEDDPTAGADAIRFRRVSARDVVVGIASSGRTPFVWGAMEAASTVGAKTALIAFNPAVKRLRGYRPDVFICPQIGPEVLTGSTRLKSGTATKMILNMLTTLAMVQCGKVIGNLMVDVKPSNEKLRLRAVRIVSTLTGWSEEEAREGLEANGWDVGGLVRRGRD